jgi:hypothetical protein
MPHAGLPNSVEHTACPWPPTRPTTQIHQRTGLDRWGPLMTIWTQRQSVPAIKCIPLDRRGSLNDDMDTESKCSRHQMYSFQGIGILRNNGLQPQFIFGEAFPITIDERKVVQKLAPTIHSRIQPPPPIEHWVHKSKLSVESALTVDWEASGKAMSSLPRGRQYHHAKIATKFVGIRYRQALCGQSEIDTCPSCLSLMPPVSIVETVPHMLKCPATRHIWLAGLDTLNRR